MPTCTRWRLAWFALLPTLIAAGDAMAAKTLDSKVVSLPPSSFLPTTPDTAICMADSGDPNGTAGRDLDGAIINDKQMTNTLCRSRCAAAGFQLAGTQASYYCFCGNSAGRLGNSTACTSRCPGNVGEICGGVWANSVSPSGFYPAVHAAPSGNGGQCIIDITDTGTGYHHRETQTWTVGARTGSTYAGTWTVTGSGEKRSVSGNTVTEGTWTFYATAPVSFELRDQTPSAPAGTAHQYLFRRNSLTANAPGAVSGSQRQIIGGKPTTPSPTPGWRYELEYPFKAFTATPPSLSYTFSGSIPANGSYGFMGGGTTKIECEWEVALGP